MNKFFRFLFFLFTFSIIIFILYETFGHRWIQAVYSGHSTPFFNTFIREQHIHTLPFYIKKADHFFFSFLLTLNVLVILSYFSFFRYAALMIIFIFSTLEISLRFLEPRLPAIYRNDPELGIQVKPFQLGSNHLGFNDEESSFKKTPSILRVLALGDSFNWAGGYEKNYWTLAEKILNLSDTKKYVEILNQGTPMTGPAYELELLKKVGILFDPDIVLLAFFVGNDFSDSFQDRDHILISRFGYPCNTLRTGKRSFPYVNLQTDSYLWFFAEHKGRELINNLQKKKNESSVLLSEEAYYSIERDRMKPCQPSFYEDSDEWKETRKYLLEIKEFLSAKAIPFYVVIIPDEYQVNPALRQELFKRFSDLNAALYDFEIPQRELSRFLSEHSIEFLDLLPSLKAQSQSPYTFRDTHWNDAGNAIAAQEVSRFLLRKIKKA